MSRVRVVNGTMADLVAKLNPPVYRTKDEIEDLVEPAMTHEEAARIAEQAMNQEVIGGCLSDPKGMLVDAEGRFTPIEANWIERAKELCNKHQSEGGRYTVQGVPNMDVVIVCHPKKEPVLGADGHTILVDKYVVFGRELGGNGEEFTTPWTCFTCDNAAKRKTSAKPHKCWRLRAPRPNYVPFMFAKAHGIDDAEDLAKELRSAWQADREQEEGTTDWSAQMEIPFSPDWQAGYLAGNPKAWNTLASE